MLFRIVLNIHDVVHLVNDAGTRSFIALKLVTPQALEIDSLFDAVDQLATAYAQSAFYKVWLVK